MACVSLLRVALAVWILGPGGRETHGFLWKCTGCLPPVADPGPCVPPSNKSAPVGLHGYKRYFANDSLIGRPVPCTRDDKICFRHNLVFDPYQDRCEPVGAGHHDNCDLTPNRTEMASGSGRIIGVCQEYQDPCPGYRMAYDGRCYRKEVVRDVICGCEAKLSRHFLGGVVCRSQPPAPITVSQPSGGCVIPDFRFPDSVRERYWKNPSQDIQVFVATQTAVSMPDPTQFSCSSEQAECFSEDTVRVSGFGGCFRLFEQGPCALDHIVALDIEAAIQGRAEATCVHERGGCPKGYKRMVFDGECHEDREIKIEAPGDITRNQFGQFILIPYRFSIFFKMGFQGNVCFIRYLPVGGYYLLGLPQPPCGVNNNTRCELYEVEAQPPNPLDE